MHAPRSPCVGDGMQPLALPLWPCQPCCSHMRAEPPHGAAAAAGAHPGLSLTATPLPPLTPPKDHVTAQSTKIGLDWRTGVAATDWDTIAKKEHLDQLSVEMRKVRTCIFVCVCGIECAYVVVEVCIRGEGEVLGACLAAVQQPRKGCPANPPPPPRPLSKPPPPGGGRDPRDLRGDAAAAAARAGDARHQRCVWVKRALCGL